VIGDLRQVAVAHAAVVVFHLLGLRAVDGDGDGAVEDVVIGVGHGADGVGHVACPV